MSRRTLDGVVENAKRFAALQRLETKIVELACEITRQHDEADRLGQHSEYASEVATLQQMIDQGRIKIRCMCRRRAAMLRGEG